MIGDFRNGLLANQKAPCSVNKRMDKGSVAFEEFFEKGKDPMIIVDLESYSFVAANQVYFRKQSHFDKVISLFRAHIQGYKKLQSVQLAEGTKSFLFNPIFHSGNEVLVQILELESAHIAHSKNRDNVSSHFFDRITVNNDLLNLLPSGILHTNEKFEALWFNEKFKLLFGREIEDDFNFVDSIYIKNVSRFWEKIDKLKREGGVINFSCAIQNLKQDGEVFIKGSAFLVEEYCDLEKGLVFILEDRTENIHFSEEITKQNLALNQINHELDKFLYSVSHNIRGPIASLEGLLKVIEISDVNTVNELKHHLRLNLRLLNGFVNDISNVATNIHTHVNFRDINLRDMMEQLLMFVDDIYMVNPQINLDIPQDYQFSTDADRFSIVVKSLLKNSFQYRDTRKDIFKIDIKVTQNEDFHLIEITDNGIGISDKVKPKIFNMFYRGTELSNGNGMGLYNCREILKKIGGTMNVESKEREWTKAKLYLPISKT